MANKLLNFVLFMCFSCVTLSASEKSIKHKSHILNFDSIQKKKRVTAKRVNFTFQEKNCCHTASYDNGEIITLVGEISPIALNKFNLETVGEQTIYMHNFAGEACHTSTSKTWEVRKGYLVHLHDGFEVHTSKKRQFVVVKNKASND